MQKKTLHRIRFQKTYLESVVHNHQESITGFPQKEKERFIVENISIIPQVSHQDVCIKSAMRNDQQSTLHLMQHKKELHLIVERI